MEQAKKLLERLKPEDIDLISKCSNPNHLCKNIMLCCMVLIDREFTWESVLSEVQHAQAFISNLKMVDLK